VPEAVEQDLGKTARVFAGLGYSELRFYGPYPFTAPESTAEWNKGYPATRLLGEWIFSG